MSKKVTKDIILSICVPTYNRPGLLKRAIDSIPDHQSIEVVVTDNSEDDESAKLVTDLFAKRQCRWQYSKNDFPSSWPGSKLMVENFNKCLKLSKGKYIMYIHDDDFLWENGLDHIMGYIQKGDQSVYQFGINLVDFQGNKIKSQTASSDGYLPPEKALIMLLSDSSVVRFPSIVAKKDAYQKVGFFNPSCKGPSDFDMWARMFATFGVYRAKRIISAYTIHDAAQTMNTFNEPNIRILLDIFDHIYSWNILTEKHFLNAKSKFFHQFILAGTFRLLKKGEMHEAKKIMHLFRIPEIKELNIPVLWLPLRVLFSVLFFVPILPMRFSYH